jgi:FHA domain/zinc-ribbon domain
MWRRRREGAQVGPARADSPGHGSVGGRPRGAGGRLRWRGRARRMDSRATAQVAWNPPAEFARQGTQTDVVPAPVAWPTEERLGSNMPSVYCTGCGRANPTGARFCSHCGTSLAYSGAEGGSETTSIIPAVGGETPDAESGEDPLADPATLAALPPGTALLVVRRGPNAGSRFLLDNDLTTVGRHPESDIFLDDVTVSRRHAEFYRQGSRFTVRDVGSLNGTYVNRERIEETDLSGGDEVQVGKFRLMFLLGPRSVSEFGGGGAQVGG